MKKRVTLQLDALMGKYKQELAETKTRQAQTKTEEDIFLNEFKLLRREIIRPVMEDIGNELRTRGHEYGISEAEELVHPKSGTQHANITMKIIPAGFDWSAYTSFQQTPSISFFALKHDKKICVWGSNMMPGRGRIGSAGPRGEFSVKEITNDVIEQEVLRVLEEIFNPTGL